MRELLSDACIYFSLNFDDCILLDETYSIWPSHFSLRDQLAMNPNIKIILSIKGNVKKKTKKNKEIEEEQTKQNNENKNEDELKDEDKVKKLAEEIKKQNDTNAIFSSGDTPKAKFIDFINLILYVIFVVFTVNDLVSQF